MPVDHAAIEARLGALPAPWPWFCAEMPAGGWRIYRPGQHGRVPLATMDGMHGEAEAEVIAHAPEDLRALLDENKALQEAAAIQAARLLAAVDAGFDAALSGASSNPHDEGSGDWLAWENGAEAGAMERRLIAENAALKAKVAGLDGDVRRLVNDRDCLVGQVTALIQEHAAERNAPVVHLAEGQVAVWPPAHNGFGGVDSNHGATVASLGRDRRELRVWRVIRADVIMDSEPGPRWHARRIDRPMTNDAEGFGDWSAAIEAVCKIAKGEDR